jgi:CO/xanthine dehydrogenase FAD-binding subunit
MTSCPVVFVTDYISTIFCVFADPGYNNEATIGGNANQGRASLSVQEVKSAHQMWVVLAGYLAMLHVHYP